MDGLEVPSWQEFGSKFPARSGGDGETGCGMMPTPSQLETKFRP